MPDKKGIILIASIFCFISVKSSFAQTNSKVNAKDFKLLKGSWFGSLTYLDCSSNKLPLFHIKLFSGTFNASEIN